MVVSFPRRSAVNQRSSRGQIVDKFVAVLKQRRTPVLDSSADPINLNVAGRQLSEVRSDILIFAFGSTVSENLAEVRKHILKTHTVGIGAFTKGATNKFNKISAQHPYVIDG